MIDTVIVIVIVAVAAAFVGRKLYRQFTAKSSGCGCSGCGQVKQCSDIQDRPESRSCCDQ